MTLANAVPHIHVHPGLNELSFLHECAEARSGAEGRRLGGDDEAIIVRLLLAYGADPNHVNRSGKAVHESNRNPSIRALLEEAS